MRPPPLPHQIDVLRLVIDRVRDHQSVPLVAFDLDGTLFDNRHRTLRIVQEFAQSVSSTDPELSAKLSRLEDVAQISYLLSDTVRGLGIEHSEALKAISSFWRDRFFTDDYCLFDRAEVGAVAFVRACYEAGASIVYLTGRDVPAMLLGTVRSLRDNGFPIGVAGIHLVLKPDASMPDEAFKRSALPSLDRAGDLVAFFDNEPANCNVCLAHSPECLTILLDTQHVPGAPPADRGVQVVTDFRTA
ncbi:MAG: haloacid dehalogenase-like hydrolase [Deltaproteobacteria bacterium]|nr:haloacid dehalogenase-like hydrolase [Deltaproteobacteria bacterium]